MCRNQETKKHSHNFLLLEEQKKLIKFAFGVTAVTSIKVVSLLLRLLLFFVFIFSDEQQHYVFHMREWCNDVYLTFCGPLQATTSTVIFFFLFLFCSIHNENWYMASRRRCGSKKAHQLMYILNTHTEHTHKPPDTREIAIPTRVKTQDIKSVWLFYLFGKQPPATLGH